jgi:hypothetical protein
LSSDHKKIVEICGNLQQIARTLDADHVFLEGYGTPRGLPLPAILSQLKRARWHLGVL